MKIYFAFRTRLSLFLIKNFSFCYAVVNLLLFPSRQSRVFSERPWFCHFRLTLSGGGLKWTRTIDLTLIRRVL